MRLKYLLIVLCSLFLTPHLAFAQQWLWAKNGEGYARSSDIASDTKGNLYMCGSNQGTYLIFDKDTLRNAVPGDIPFLVKYDSKGNYLWCSSPIGRKSSDDEAWSVATDKFNNVFMAGQFTDTITFGSTTLYPSEHAYFDGFIVKYDSSGNLKWAKQTIHKTSNDAWIYSVAVDPKGNSYILGYSTDTTRFGSFKLTRGVFLVKYDSVGNVKWAKSSGCIGVGPSNNLYDVTIDKFNNIYITGTSTDTISFGTDTIYGTINENTFLVKYDSAGNVKWAKGSSGAGQSFGTSVTIDVTGNVYITGVYQEGTEFFGTDTLQASGWNDFLYLVKYDSSGKVIWAKNSFVPYSNVGNFGLSVVTDRGNNVYLAIAGDTDVILGADTLHLPSGWTNPYLIVEFDSTGKIICSTALGNGGGVTWFDKITIEPQSQEICIEGSIINQSPFIIGNDTLQDANNNSLYPFIAKWLPCYDTLTTVPQLIKVNRQVSVYPNPNNGAFIIALQNVNEQTQVEVYNILGEEVYKAKLNSNSTQLDIGIQPQGIYFYRILTERGGLIGSGKLIIKK
jgi:hypothetical protein